MINKDKVKKNFSRAKKYDEFTSYHNLTLKMISEYASSNIIGIEMAERKAVNVLDVGCGTASGYFFTLDAFNKAGVKARLFYTGVDFAKGILQKASHKIKLSEPAAKELNPAFLVCGDALKLPVPKGKFDIVFSNMALQWVEDYESFITECAYACAPDAQIILSFLAFGTLIELADSCRKSRIAEEIPVKLHDFPKTETIISLAEKHGLKVTGSKIINHIEYGKSSAALLKRINLLGAKNTASRSFTGISRLKKILETYDENYKNKDGLVFCTYKLAFLTFSNNNRPR